jgi:hypothetical protein
MLADPLTRENRGKQNQQGGRGEKHVIVKGWGYIVRHTIVYIIYIISHFHPAQFSRFPRRAKSTIDV